MGIRNLLVITFCALQMQAQQVWYVDQNAPLSGNGRSWNSAFENLQEALDGANPDDEIWIAKGIYTASSTGDRTSFYIINKSLKLYGGFLGNERSLSERNTDINQTIFSGEINNPLSNEDNSVRLFHLEGVMDLYVNNISINDVYGDLNSEMDSRAHGSGAILSQNLNGYQSLIFEDCQFENNHADKNGGVINFYDNAQSESSIVFKGCTFIGNNAFRNGSIFNIRASSPEANIRVERCRFERNDPDGLGRSYFNVSVSEDGNTIVFDNLYLEDNSMSDMSAMFTISLGGYSNFRFSESKIINNSSLGQIFVMSVGSGQGSDVLFDQVLIKDNETFDPPIRISSSAFGELLPDIAINNSEISNHINGETWHLIDLKEVNLVSFDNNRFLNNWAGPLNVSPLEVDLKVTNCLVAYNEFRANDFSNQFNFNNPDNKSVEFLNCTFAHNAGRKGSIVRTQFNNDNLPLGDLTFMNCIFFDNFDFDTEAPNPDRLVYTRNSNVRFEHCLFEQNNCNDLVTIDRNGRLECGDNSLFNSNPRFINDDNYYLAFCSPAIDAGSNELLDSLKKDLDQNVRVQNNQVDLGALENTPTDRFIGFSCSDGVIYSDWLSGIEQGAEFEYLNEGVNGIINGEARYILRSNEVCVDTLSFPVQQINGIQFVHSGIYEFATVPASIQVDIQTFVGGDFEIYVFPDVPYSINETATQINISPLNSGLYYLAAVNEQGCFVLDSLTVNITDKKGLFYIANTFSPNGDGMNDALTLNYLGDDQALIQKFAIYDRSGSKIFESGPNSFNKNTKLWDGKNKNRDSSSGVYVYHAEVMVNGEVITLKGDVTLLY